MGKEISVVLGTYNRKKFLKRTIDSIRAELDHSGIINYEIIVIDGGSNDGTLGWLIQQKDVLTIVQHNRGKWRGTDVPRRSWGYFMNLGFRIAQGKYVCMLSDDCLIVPGSILSGFQLFEERLKNGEKVGAIAFYWRNWPDQERYWIGVTLNDKLFVNHGMYLNQALKDVDYIDEDTYSFYYADGDLCLRMWKEGYSIIESPNSYIEHFSHANKRVRKANLQNVEDDLEKFLDRWQGIDDEKSHKQRRDWIYKDYNDRTQTYRTFIKISPLFYIRYRMINKIASILK